MDDPLIIRHLVEKQLNNDYNLVTNINDALRGPRFLDGPVKPLKLADVKIVDTYGVKETFKATWAQFFDPEYENDLCSVSLPNREIQCTYPIKVVLQTINTVGISKLEEVALTCKRMFLELLQMRVPMLTLQSVYSYFTRKTDNYYESQICSAVLEVAYGDAKQLECFIYDNVKGVIKVEEFLSYLKSLGIMGMETLHSYEKGRQADKTFINKVYDEWMEKNK